MKNFNGFTLVELLVLLAVVAILAVIAIPDFSATIKNNRDISQVNSLVDALSLARSESVKSGTLVTVCPGQSKACGDSNWADGWVVFYNTLPKGATTSTIRVYAALDGNNKLTAAPAATTIVYEPSGMTTLPPGNFIDFTLCDTRGAAYARSIHVASTGHAESAPTVGKDVTGATLTCP